MEPFDATCELEKNAPFFPTGSSLKHLIWIEIQFNVRWKIIQFNVCKVSRAFEETEKGFSF